MKKKQLFIYLFVVFCVVLVDQASKIYVEENFRLYESYRVIDGFLNFTYARNTGVAFSFGADLSPVWRGILFKFFPIVICLVIFKLLWDSLLTNKILCWAYTFILGGAIGNIIDRIRLDYVVDFIAVYSYQKEFLGITMPKWHFAIFNIADSFVNIAVVLLLIDYYKTYKAKKKNAT